MKTTTSYIGRFSCRNQQRTLKIIHLVGIIEKKRIKSCSRLMLNLTTYRPKPWNFIKFNVSLEQDFVPFFNQTTLFSAIRRFIARNKTQYKIKKLHNAVYFLEMLQH